MKNFILRTITATAMVSYAYSMFAILSYLEKAPINLFFNLVILALSFVWLLLFFTANDEYYNDV